MVFFMKSGDYEQLLGAQLRNLGLKVDSSLKLYSPSIVPLAPAAANAAPGKSLRSSDAVATASQKVVGPGEQGAAADQGGTKQV